MNVDGCGQQRGRGLSLGRSGEARRQVIPNVAALLTARLHHRPNTRQVRTTTLTLGAVALLPPQHPMTQSTLRRIVRRLDSRYEREQKQRYLPMQQLSARCRRPRAAAHAPTSQHGTETHAKITLRMQTTRKMYLGQRPITDTLPPAQHLTRQRQQLPANPRTGVGAVDHGLEVAAQMRPTQLMPLLGQMVVQAVPVAGQDTPIVRTYQGQQRQAITAPDYLIDSGHGCYDGPQPSATPHRRLIDVGGLLACHTQQFVHHRPQMLTDLRLGGADLAGTQGNSEPFREQACGLSLAKTIGAGQQDAGRLQAGSVLARRRGAAASDAAAAAEEAMAAIFRDDGADRRHVPNLMTQRLRIIALERLPAIAAHSWFTVLDGVGTFDERPLALGMSGLSSGLFAGGLLGWCAFDGRGIGGRRFGGVGGILLESRFEVGESLLVVLD